MLFQPNCLPFPRNSEISRNVLTIWIFACSRNDLSIAVIIRRQMILAKLIEALSIELKTSVNFGISVFSLNLVVFAIQQILAQNHDVVNNKVTRLLLHSKVLDIDQITTIKVSYKSESSHVFMDSL